MSGEDLLIMMTGAGKFKRAAEPPRPDPDATGSAYAGPALRHWLWQHKISVTGFAAAAGLSRPQLNALLGVGGRHNPWPTITRSTADGLVRAMSLIAPVSREEVRAMLRLEETDAWLPEGLLEGLSDVPLQHVGRVQVHYITDREESGGPHVCWTPEKGTFVAASVPSGARRVGRLISIKPV